MTTSALRQDIQQLRAIAVIAVIVNHLGVSWLPGGYLGVDMFFVVSGFVITNSMLSGNTQSPSRLRFFAQFWIRRVFRLWPMLFVTVLATSALLLLTGLGQPDTFITGIASLVGISNLRLLLGRLDYFALDTGTDWFMHTWSLAVEEQVYVILSLIFAVFGGSRITTTKGPLRAITAVISVLVIASLAFSFAPFTTELVRFYSPHTRLYQICAGALLALVAARVASKPPKQSTPIKQSLVFVGLAGLFAQFFTNIAAGATASLMSTLFTTLVLASATPSQYSTGFVPTRLLGAIGDRSYALYLVHWPAQLLATNLIDNAIGKTVFSLGLTLALGIAGYRLIENPTRHQWRRTRARHAIGIALCGLLTTLALTSAGYGYVNRSDEPMATDQLAAKCDADDSPIWTIGDSHFDFAPLQPIVSELLAGNCRNIGGYGLVLDLQWKDEVSPGRRAVRIRLLPTGWLLERIRNAEVSPQALVIVHFLSAFLSPPQVAPTSANFVATEWQAADGSSVTREEFLKLFQNNLQQIATVLDEHGGALLVTSPPPDFDWLRGDIEPSLCSNRLVVSRECAILRTPAVISRQEHEARGGDVRRILDELSTRFDNFVHIALDAPFCNSRGCSNFRGSELLYMDDDHLNIAGAKLVEPLFAEVFAKVIPSGKRELSCPPGASVYSCRILTRGGLTNRYSTSPTFVGQPQSSDFLQRATHTDDERDTYCVSLWASNEATFTPGRCE